jgi:signal transduction histidine kinase/ActR/RegA family two-component response regulator
MSASAGQPYAREPGTPDKGGKAPPEEGFRPPDPALTAAAVRRRLAFYFLGAVLLPLMLGALLLESMVGRHVAGPTAELVRADLRNWLMMLLPALVVAAVVVSSIAARLFSRPFLMGSTAILEARVRERTGELEEKSRRGEESDRLKSLFIANMSHEIRTPLNSVLALSQLLRDEVPGPLTMDQRRYLEVIERNGQNLLRLINDILDLSRIEAGYVEMDTQDVDVGAQVAQVVSNLTPLAAAKDLDLTVKLPDDLPAVRGDADRLQQILTNLVGNAIKFTDTGTVQVSAEARDAAVAIHVIDTGVGIPEAYLGKIFQEFVQVDQTLARRQGGTGLGLAIASRLARLMDGKITVSSIVGSGSRFTLTLPKATSGASIAETTEDVTESTHSTASPAPMVGAGVGAGTPAADGGPGQTAGEPEASLAGRRILIVEDNEDNLFTLRQVLARLPLEIETATTGRQAIEHCRRNLPDLVIMDMQMPGMSGLQATGAIRALPGGDSVPILALTAQAMKGDRERILAAGCDEYLSKPVQPKAMIETVQRLLRRGGDAPPPGGRPPRGDGHARHRPGGLPGRTRGLS